MPAAGCEEASGCTSQAAVREPGSSQFERPSIKPDKYYWEAYVNRGDRIIYIPEGSHLVLVDVVAHNDIKRYSNRPARS